MVSLSCAGRAVWCDPRLVGFDARQEHPCPAPNPWGLGSECPPEVLAGRVAGVQRNFPDLRVTPRPGPAGRLVRSRWRWQTLGGSKQRGGGQPRRGGDEELAHVHHHPINSDGSGGAIPDAARRYRVNSATRPVSMPVPSQPFGRQGFYEPDLGRLGLTHRTSGSERRRSVERTRPKSCRAIVRCPNRSDWTQGRHGPVSGRACWPATGCA